MSNPRLVSIGEKDAGRLEGWERAARTHGYINLARFLRSLADSYEDGLTAGDIEVIADAASQVAGVTEIEVAAVAKLRCFTERSPDPDA